MRKLQLNEKLVPFMTKPQPIKVAYGGRNSGKSTGISDMLTVTMESKGLNVYCLREEFKTIEVSIHNEFKASINDRLKLEGWRIMKNSVVAPNGARTYYAGANRNPNAMRGAKNFFRSWFEEAEDGSEDSLSTLLPTIIRVPGAQCWFSANPQSRSDPFSKRFILPFLGDLKKHGYYEDELHYIVRLNWRDNPWWYTTPELEMLRQHDIKHMTRAKYDWIWEGEFNDNMENSIIDAEWFDACVDAHIKLGIPEEGVRLSAHDPSDEGADDKGYAFRHGIVIKYVDYMENGDVADGCNWAIKKAKQDGAQSFIWDCDGLGLGLGQQVAEGFKGVSIHLSSFRGSEGVDFPEEAFNPLHLTEEMFGLVNDTIVKNKDALKNKRAQYYWRLRERIYKTFEAVVKKVYHDPSELISFSSEMEHLHLLRSEICSVREKHESSSKFRLYTKKELKKEYNTASQNLADCVMMLMRMPEFQDLYGGGGPRPIEVMGGRRRWR